MSGGNNSRQALPVAVPLLQPMMNLMTNAALVMWTRVTVNHCDYGRVLKLDAAPCVNHRVDFCAEILNLK